MCHIEPAVLGDRILPFSEVCQQVGLRKTSVYGLIAEGAFPRPIRLTAQRRGWLSSEVAAWIEARKAERDHA